MWIILPVYLIIFYEMQCPMKRQTSVMKYEGHEPPPPAGCSSCPVGQANLMAKLYAKFWIQNYQNVYTAGLNDAINILLVKLGLVHLSSQCIGLDVLKTNICYSPALTIPSCLSYSVTNRPSWKMNNKLIYKGLNKQTTLNLFDHMGVLCSAKRK
jgi:hypothetical protein